MLAEVGGGGLFYKFRLGQGDSPGRTLRMRIQRRKSFNFFTFDLSSDGEPARRCRSKDRHQGVLTQLIQLFCVLVGHAV